MAATARPPATAAADEASTTVCQGQSVPAARMRWGRAVPRASMPTSQPSARPRASGAQPTASFMPTGYMPARARPVRKRRARAGVMEVASRAKAALAAAPNSAEARKTRLAWKRSARPEMAMPRVPVMKPSCTALVR